MSRSSSFRVTPSFRGLTAESSAVKRTNYKATTLDSAVKPRNDGVRHRMSMLLLLSFLFLTIFTSTVHAFTENPYPFTSTTQEKRFESLTKTIRCVVCQNQSIADSNAPLANDLRNKVYKMVLDNQSDHDIQDYLVKRYGEFILLQPRMSKLTIVLWTFPFIAIGIVLFMLILKLTPGRQK